MGNNTIEFYGYKEQERLSLCAEDVVRDLMEDEDYADFPIKVYVFRPMSITDNVEKFSKHILEDILENLDQDYGDPDGDYTEPTEDMKKAALALAEVIVKDYKSWMCEPTGEVIEFSKVEAKKIVRV